jgi:rubredoxin
LDKALEGAIAEGAQTEKVILNELSIRPCQECGGCDETGICVIEDDMRLLYDKLTRTQGLIVASPIFFSGVSAQLKAMIDRIQCHWVGKYRLKHDIATPPGPRKGVFISVRGQKGHEVFQAAAKPVKAFMATEGFAYLGELFRDELEEKGAASNQPRTLTQAYELGRQLVNEIKEGLNMHKWECSVCGYIYNPEAGDAEADIPPGTDFKNLPEDWVCPVCGADKSMFQQLEA